MFTMLAHSLEFDQKSAEEALLHTQMLNLSADL